MTVQADDHGFTPELFRSVMGHFATGVAVVTAITDGEPHGMTIQSFSSLSLDPPLVMLCPARSSTSWAKIAEAGHLVINMLSHDQEALAQQFARRGADKYADTRWAPAPHSGAPVLEGALAWIDCSITDVHEGGDHLIAVCAVKALEADAERHPLLFFRSGFWSTDRSARQS